MMAAIAAGRMGAEKDLSVHLFDGAKKPGAKILVSGGSRCNVTNAHVVPARFEGEGAARFVDRILRAFSPDQTRRFFEEIGVELKLEPTGKFFPVSDSSRTVLNALLASVDAAGAIISRETPVESLIFQDEEWRLQTPDEIVEAKAVVLATGGLALPKSGSDGRGFELARRFGHTIIETTPALTPLLAREDDHRALSGVTVPARLTLFRGREPRPNERLASFEGSFLFTHIGYSGPVALNVSRHVARARPQNPGASVFASWLPDIPESQESAWWQDFSRENARKTVVNALNGILPERLAQTIARRARCGNELIGRLGKIQIASLRRELFACFLPVDEVAPYEKAETTAGGIALREINPATMMSRLQPGLFFAGEVCDVDGWLGGYNFQWCWSSGTVAGRAAAKWVATQKDVA